MRVYYTHKPLKESSWQLIMWVWSLHLHSSVTTEWGFLALIQCHLLTNLFFFFFTQTPLATGPSSPRSQVTVFSLWAPTISRFLLIAEQKETHLHNIGTCKPHGEATVFDIEWTCTESILGVFCVCVVNFKGDSRMDSKWLKSIIITSIDGLWVEEKSVQGQIRTTAWWKETYW